MSQGSKLEVSGTNLAQLISWWSSVLYDLSYILMLNLSSQRTTDRYSHKGCHLILCFSTSADRQSDRVVLVRRGCSLLLALQEVPLAGLWLQASPASNRFFLDATASGVLGMSTKACFAALASWELWKTPRKKQSVLQTYVYVTKG